MPSAKPTRSRRTAYFLYGGLAGLTWLVPLLVAPLQLPFVRLMDEVYHPLVYMQLFVFCAAAVLTLFAALVVWRAQRSGWEAQLPYLAGILISLQILTIMRHYDGRAWDYLCYEHAAQAIVQGHNPYGDCYIYFPTPAQALALVYQLAAWGSSIGGEAGAWQRRWDIVFYSYETAQFYLIIGAYFLCYRFATAVGIERVRATFVVSLLFLLNNPLLATLKHNQVNLWVLDLVLLAMLWLPRYPWLSGLCVAIGGHVKLYPLIMLMPWTLKRKWQALASAGIGLVTILLIQTGGGRHWTLWQQFLGFADSFPQGTFFRDNSLHSFVYNLLGHLKWLMGISGFGDPGYVVNERYVNWVVLAGMAILGLLYLYRVVAREFAVPLRQETTTTRNSTFKALDLKLVGDTLDAIALGLLVSPVVWEHHYLLAMPLLIWAVSQVRAERLWLVGVSGFLIFALPTFDVFPLSYHRMAGLLLLLYLVAPLGAPNWLRRAKGRLTLHGAIQG